MTKKEFKEKKEREFDEWIDGNIEKFKNTDPIVEAVKAKLDSRSQVGIKKYGTTLADNKKVNRKSTYWLEMALEETLDLANYLQCQIMHEELRLAKK